MWCDDILLRLLGVINWQNAFEEGTKALYAYPTTFYTVHNGVNIEMEKWISMGVNIKNVRYSE